MPVPSAILMAKSLVYFLESDLCLDSRSPLEKEDARQFLIRREILRAVASHTSPDIYHLEFDSLAFLLFLADEIQEGGRPTLKEQLGGDELATWACEQLEFQKDRVRVAMTTTAKLKDKKGKQRVDDRLGKVRRKLRLAVDMPKMRKLQLDLSIKDADGKRKSLVLGKDGSGKFGIRIVDGGSARARRKPK